MADSKELQTQLQINQQINKALADRSKQLDAMSKQMSGQAQLAKELCAAMDCQDLDGLEDRLGSINASLSEAADQAGKAGAGMDKMASDGSKGGDKLGGSLGNILSKITPMKGAAVGAGLGFIKGFKGVGGMLKMVMGGIKGVASGIAKVGMSVAMIPFKILGGFVDAAVSGSGGVNQLAQAMEEVRGEFGDLATGEGKAVVDGFNSMRSSSSALAKAGLNVGRVFGYGNEGAAAMLKAVVEVAKAAGPAFSMLSETIAGAADKMIMLNKGLGMSNEALAEMARKAHNTGKDVGQNLVDIGSMAIQMGDKFGVSSKTIGKNMSMLIENVEDFGNMSRVELGATATYMAKLGLAAKDLQGVIGKFDDFETAAGSVSMLNSQFGIQLDTMEMMNAENPAERIDMMKNAFHEAGNAVEDMTRQEKKLMAEQMGLSVSAMENALATENMGTSYEDMEGAAEESEANKMSENEVMLELSKSIQKLVKGGQGVEGFFDAFKKGFARGFKQNQEYKDSIYAIRQSLKVVMEFGREVGKVFAEMMGTMGLFKSIKKIFDPKAMRELLLGSGGLLGMLKDFQKGTKDGAPYSLADMLKDMFVRVKEYLTTGAVAEGTSGFASFIEQMIRFMGDALASVLPMLVEKIAEMIQFMADVIRDPSILQNLSTGASDGIGGALMDSFAKIGAALAPALPLLFDALKDLFSALYEKAKPFLMFGLKRVIFFAVTKAFVSALAKAAMGAAIGGAAKLFAKMTGLKLGKNMDQTTGKTMEKEGGGFFKGIGSLLKTIGELSPSTVAKAGFNLLILAAFAAGSLVAFAIGVRLAYEVLKPVPWEGLAKVFAVLGISILAMIPFVAAALMMEPTTITTAGTMMLIGAAFFAISVVAFSLAIRAAYEVLKPVGWKDFAAILGFVGFAILATIALGVIGIGLAQAAPAFPAMVTGLVGAAALFALGVGAYAVAIVILYELLKSIPLEEFRSQLEVVGMAILATIAFGGMGAGLAFFSPLVPLMIVGLIAAAALFVGGVFVFGEAIQTALPAFKKIAKDQNALSVGMVALDTVINAMGKMGKLAVVFAAIGMFVFILKKGFNVAADFFKSTIGDIEDMIVAVLRIPMANPADLAKRMEVVGKIGEAMQAMAGIALDAAKMGMVSELLGGTSMPDMFKAMGGFLKQIAGIMTEMITLIIELAAGLSPDQLKGVEVIASVLNAIAGLAGALFSPLEAVSKMSSGMFGSSVSDAMTAVVEGLGVLMESISFFLPELIRQIIEIANGIEGDPAALKPRMEIISIALGAVGSFAKAIGDVAKLMPEEGGGFFSDGKSMGERLGEMSQIISRVVNQVKKHMPPLIASLLAIEIKGDPAAVKAKIEVIGAVMTAISQFADVISKLAGLQIPDGASMGSLIRNIVTGVKASLTGDDGLQGLFTALSGVTLDEAALAPLDAANTALSKLTSFGANIIKMQEKMAEVPGGGMAVAVMLMVAEAKLAIEALNSLQDLDATVALDTFAQAIGTSGGEFTISNEAINVTMNVTVTMDADKIAKVLVDKSVMTTPLVAAE
jgi:hypothetical protein